MSRRTIGVFRATGVGVGAIVGGGILVLSGAAYARTGPAAVLAFAINGFLAFLTALSFAEIASRFPQSGGAYTFAKRVLSVRAAFAVGWVLWFAYIVAGALYALGFGAYAVLAIEGGLQAAGLQAPAWLQLRGVRLVLGVAATVVYVATLVRKSSGGGQWETAGKLAVFAVLIVGGAWVLPSRSPEQLRTAMTPFFVEGTLGLVSAMGVTFIALQGFEIIAGIAGEVREPQRNVPRAMFLSLAIALVVYLPLLVLAAAVGVPEGESIERLAREQPDTVIALAVENYLGASGYWMVVVAAILSTLSALHANLLAASRVAYVMAGDGTLPSVLGLEKLGRGTPHVALYATALTLLAILLMMPDLASAGAAASLIFLVSFALAHAVAVLARVRSGDDARAFQMPWFPLVPLVGGLGCAALALFQLVTTPSAAAVVLVWFGLGAILYLSLFSRSAEIWDASRNAFDPELQRLRGRNPLVLVPVANPARAQGLISVANALAPRVQMLTVIRRVAGGGSDDERALSDVQRAVQRALVSSYAAGHAPEVLITTAPDPWREIERVAEATACDNLLLGFGSLDPASEARIEALMNAVHADVTVLSAPPDWTVARVQRVLVPVARHGDQHEVRARLLASLCRQAPREITFATVLPADATEQECAAAQRETGLLAELKIPTRARTRILRSDDAGGALLEEARHHDLLVLGLRSVAFGPRVFGDVALRLAEQAPCATVLLGRRRYRPYELWQPLRDAVKMRRRR